MLRTRFVQLFAAAAVTAAFCAPAMAFNPLDGCNPTWTTQPSPYWVNVEGYSRISFGTVLEIFADGFTSWSAPCCSSWEAAYQGTTTRVAEDNTASQNIFSFRETNWPSQLGDARWTLAVTLTTWQPTRNPAVCNNLTADMVFNAANATFATNGRQGTDLQSVTTHEQGHWLGLDHTPITTATMYETYIGEDGRTLHQDDEDGVCFLYPGSCGCATDADCTTPGHACVGGFCIEPPCGSDADCDDGLICDVRSGDCLVPPCLNDSQCSANEICVEGDCVVDRDCEICAPCVDNADCGAAALCLSDGVTPGVCSRSCPSGDRDCPGDSACFGVDDGAGTTYQLCFNPDANVEVCPASYVCTDPCADVVCDADQVCDPDTGGCIDIGGGPTGECSVCEVCDVDADCGAGGQCVFFEGDTSGVCSVSCDSTECPGDSACFELTFVGGGSTNLCFNPDAGSVGACPGDYVCAGAEPEPVDPCEGVTCTGGQTCDPVTGECVGGGEVIEQPGDCPVCWTCTTDADCGLGQCLNLSGTNLCVLDCSLQGCPGNTACFEVPDADGGVISICLNDDAASNGVCYPQFACDLSEPVEDVGGGEADAGTDTGGTGGGETPIDGTDTRGSSGGSCAAVPGPTPWLGLVAGFGALLVGRRRRFGA